MGGERNAGTFQEICKDFVSKVVDLLGEGEHQGNCWHMWILGDDNDRMVRVEDKSTNTILIFHSTYGILTFAATSPTEGTLEFVSNRDPSLEESESEWLQSSLADLHRVFLPN